MGGVNEAPILINGAVVQQPLHRPNAVMGQAFLHLAPLFGDM
jgi:hypothetical protein